METEGQGGVIDPSLAPLTALSLSPEALRVLRRGKFKTISDVQNHRQDLLRVRNLGKTLQAEILKALAAWEATDTGE